MTPPVEVSAAVERGESVIPLGADKRPLLVWKPFQAKRADEAQVWTWMRDKRPAAWGVVTGAISSIVILDFDGEDGRATCEQFGLAPHTLTPNGGLHVRVEHPGFKVPTLNGKADADLRDRYPGMDVRGDGGFAAFDGSIKRADGERGSYAFLRDPAPIAWDELNEELRDFLRARGERAAAPIADAPPIEPGERIPTDTLLQRALRDGVSGARNQSAFGLACQLRDNGYSAAEAESVLLAYASRVPTTDGAGQHDPYTADEARRTLQSAFSRPPREAWGAGDKRLVLEAAEQVRLALERARDTGDAGAAYEASAMLSVLPDDQQAAFLDEFKGVLEGQINLNTFRSRIKQERVKRNRVPDDVDGRPRIVVNGRPLRDVSDDALAAIKAKNDPPSVFERGAALVGRDEHGRPFIERMGDQQVRGRLTRVANTVNAGDKGDSHVSPPDHVVSDVIARGDWKLPPLEAITQAPAMRPDGSILRTPGYDAATSLLYAPAADLRMPDVPDSPTPAQIVAAVAVLDDALGDFPFADVASRANAIALLLTVLLRPALDGQAPLCIVEATKPGSGKGLLVNVASIVATGHEAAPMVPCAREEEWAKTILSLLLGGTGLIVFDEVQLLASGTLALALTTRLFTGRALGRNVSPVAPQRATWVAMGNNPKLGGDLGRRVFFVTIDARVARPEERTAFKHTDLLPWVKEHRGELIAALLTLTRAWHAADCPRPAVKPMGSFENWTTTVGGILEVAGVDGFLSNTRERRAVHDEGSGEWERFLRALADHYEGSTFTASDVDAAIMDSTGALVEALPGDLADALTKPGRSFSRRLGKALSKQEGTRYAIGDVERWIERAGIDGRGGTVLWQIGSAGLQVSQVLYNQSSWKKGPPFEGEVGPSAGGAATRQPAEPANLRADRGNA